MPDILRARRSSNSWSSLALAFELDDSKDMRAGSTDMIIFRAATKEDATRSGDKLGVDSTVDRKLVSVLASWEGLCLA